MLEHSGNSSATSTTSDAPPLASSMHARTSLTRDALGCIIYYLPANALAGSGDRQPSSESVDNAGVSTNVTEPFMSVDVLFARAAQAPSAAASVGAVEAATNATTAGTAAGGLFPSSAAFSASAGNVTRPLALLAASPLCRRALEECLAGGCVLSPQGSLTLQVCQRDPAATTRLTLLTLSPSRVQRVERHGSHTRGTCKRSEVKPSLLPSSLAAATTAKTAAEEAAAQCPQLLVVTSINVPRGTTPPLQPVSVLSRSPARSPVQRPQSARVQPLPVRPTASSPPSASAVLPLPPPPPPLGEGKGHFNRNLTPSVASPAVISSTSGRGECSPRSSDSSCSNGDHAALPRGNASTAVTEPSTSPMKTALQRSPVLLHSCRVPVSALLRTSATAAAAAAVASPTASISPSLLPAQSSPLRPISFPSLSPCLPPSTPPTRLAASADVSRSSSPASAALPPSLQSLYHALWWVRRGPLPVSLSLLRYAEADVLALWNMLEADAVASSADVGGDDDGAKSQEGTEATRQRHKWLRNKENEGSGNMQAGDSTCLSIASQDGTSACKRPTGNVGISGPPLLRLLPSPVTELHVHGRAADTAVPALLAGHPEVRAVRLTHATLAETQLRDLRRYCPDVTHLSLAMNDHLRSTSFLCATPSETSFLTTTAPISSGAVSATSLSEQQQQQQQRLPSAPTAVPGSRSPRASLCPAAHRVLDPQQRDESEKSAFSGHRGGLPRSPALPLVAAATGARSMEGAATRLAGPQIQNNDACGACDGNSDATAQKECPSLSGAPSTRSDGAEDTRCSRSTQPPPPTSKHLPHHPTTQDALRNSQIDLFAAEEEGEAEMQLSLWQAAQTDAAERRQAVFILRPSDVVLGGRAGEGEGSDARGGEGGGGGAESGVSCGELTATSMSVEGQGAKETGHTLVSKSTMPAFIEDSSGTADEATAASAVPLLSFLNEDRAHFHDDVHDEVVENDGGNSTVTAACTEETTPLLPSVSSTTTITTNTNATAATRQHTDPHHSPDVPARSIDATLVELKTSLWKASAASLPTCVREPRNDKTAAPAAALSASASTLTDASSTICEQHHPSPALRKRLSAHWSETLIDLDLSYTQVLDEDAARDVPQLRMLRRLSLEGCMRLSQLRWLPLLSCLRELNLSFSSVLGSALHPLGSCAQLSWLKLEGCLSFTSVEQLWKNEEVRDGAQGTVAAAAATTAHATATAGASHGTARVVRYRTAGGIPAITVLPASAGSAAAAVVVAANDDGRENEVNPAEAATATAGAGEETAGPPSPPPPSPPRAPEDAANTIAPPPLFNSLRVLIATSTGLTDEGLRPLHHLVSLECLVLDRCAAVSDVNVAAQLPSVHTLDASRTGVTAEGLAALRHARTLRQLRLQGCLALTQLPAFFVEPTGLTKRADVFNTRRELTAHRSSSGSRPSSSAAAVPGLRVLDVSLCSNLSAGSVEGLVVDSAAAARVQEAAAAQEGERLPRGNAAPPSPRSFAPPCELPQLRHLLLRSCDAVARLTSLRGFTCVVELDLYHTSVDETALTTATAWWTCLEVLNVASTRVGTLAAWCPAEDGGGDQPPLPPPPKKKSEQHDAAGHAPVTAADLVSTHTAHATPPSTSLSLTASRPPVFACTLRVLALSNTEVTSEGLLALRHFPRLEVLQLSNCRRLTSLSFLRLQPDGASACRRKNSSSHCSSPLLPQQQQPQQQRTALRELIVTEAADLTNEEALPYLAACPGLRLLSLAGCAQIGGTETPLTTTPVTAVPSPSRGSAAAAASVAAVAAVTSSVNSPHVSAASASPARLRLLPPLVADTKTRRNSDTNNRKTSSSISFAVLRCISDLTELNLSRTAVTQADLRALLRPPSVQKAKTLVTPHVADSSHAARAAARLNLLSTASSSPSSSKVKLAAPDATSVSYAERRSDVRDEGSSGDDSAALAFAPQQLHAGTSLQRLWLRGCRALDEETLLATAAEAETKMQGGTIEEKHGCASGVGALASVREVHLSRGRFGAAVLQSLLQ